MQPTSHSIYLKFIVILSAHLRPRLSSDPFPSGSPTNVFHPFHISHMSAPYPSDLILQDLITLIIPGAMRFLIASRLEQLLDPSSNAGWSGQECEDDH
jgi:hypothetical protein